MNDEIYLRKKCTCCAHENFDEVLNLGFHPLADTFVKKENPTINNVFVPLIVMHCKNCNHFFTKYFISPQRRYSHNEYSYETGNSRVAVQHFQEFSWEIIKNLSLCKTSKIIDIGGNDGTFLKQFYDSGFTNLLNVEPSENIARLSESKNSVSAINIFYGESIYEHIIKSSVDLIITANVLNHFDNVQEFFKISEKLLKDGGHLVCEVPDVSELIARNAFDTIYHEHVNYFSVNALSKVGMENGLTMIRWDKSDYMCGSVRVYFAKNQDLKAKQTLPVPLQSDSFIELSKKMKSIKMKLLKLVCDLKNEGKAVFCIGAATKGNTLLNYVGLDNDLIDFICDHTELKVGKIAPGSMIPIIHDRQIPNNSKNAIILPSNLAEFLKPKFEHLGLRFIEPLKGEFLNED